MKRRFTPADFGFEGTEIDAKYATGAHMLSMLEHCDHFQELVSSMADSQEKEMVSTYFNEYRVAMQILALRNAMDDNAIDFDKEPHQTIN